MAEEAPNIVLEYLRRIDRKVDTVIDDVRSLNLRMGSIEHHLSGVHASDVDQTSEIDRLKRRVDKIERRLELNE